MLTVWGRKTSSNVQALMWCIGEMELPYVRHDIGHKYKGTETDFSIHLTQTGPFRFCRMALLRLCGRREQFSVIWLIATEQKASGLLMTRKKLTLIDGLNGQKLMSRRLLPLQCSGVLSGHRRKIETKMQSEKRW